MDIAVFGTGYVGLVTGTCFADTGNNVICVDINEEKIKMLTNGISPIYEPGLDEMLRRNIKAGRLIFTMDAKNAVENSLVIFIAVGTPPDENGAADLKSVQLVAEEIGRYLNEYKIIVMKSTVPVGTSDMVKKIISSKTKQKFHVASNPEFLKEGTAIEDCMMPERIIVGTDSEKVAQVMRELYAPFVRTGNPIYIMDIHSAEITKYAANAMLATRISFMNEFARFCEIVGADIEAVRIGIGSDSRIGKRFLFAGAGYGGSCFPKDVKAIIQTAENRGYEMKILKSVDSVNTTQKIFLAKKVEEYFKGRLPSVRITVWGLSFKPKTDDMREAPSIDIINYLLDRGVQIVVHDPVAMKSAKKIFSDQIEFADSYYDALKGANALILITEWNEYRYPDFAKMRQLMVDKVIFDGRNIYDPEKMKKLGFKYFGIGRLIN